MNELLSWTIMGIVATLGMTSFLWLITGLTRFDVDMVRAVGSIYTRKVDNALAPGLILQLTSGVIIAYVYAIFLRIPNFDVAYQYAGLGLVMGTIHGVVVSVVLAVLISEHHPIQTYQKVDALTAVFHVFGHMIYGMVIGVMYATFMV